MQDVVVRSNVCTATYLAQVDNELELEGDMLFRHVCKVVVAAGPEQSFAPSNERDDVYVAVNMVLSQRTDCMRTASGTFLRISEVVTSMQESRSQEPFRTL